jgi:hypothetical protein
VSLPARIGPVLREAINRCDRGEPIRDIASSYNVSHPTISRLSA